MKVYDSNVKEAILEMLKDKPCIATSPPERFFMTNDMDYSYRQVAAIAFDMDVIVDFKAVSKFVTEMILIEKI